MGISAVLAGIALLAASGLLIAFFVTENEAADTASNWLFLAFYALMGWTVVEVHRVYVDDAGWVWVLTIVALATLLFLFIAQLLIVLGQVDFTRVAIATTVGFLILLLWMLAASVLILTQGHLPAALGWFGVGVITFAIFVIGLSATDRELMMGEKTPGPAMNVLYGVILAGLTAWLLWLGLAPLST